MASVLCQLQGRVPCLGYLAQIRRGIVTTSCACKNIRSGVQKITIKSNKPLTYEEAMAPETIGTRKAWNSWNSSNLKDEGRKAETTWEDMFIRRFVKGTWSQLFLSEIIIKRRFNMIVIAGLVTQSGIQPRSMYFLWGYTEEVLSYFLKCPVKLELQTVQSKKDVIFKHI